MKKRLVLFVSLLSAITSYSQIETTENSEIEKVILNYIENFFENNFDNMNESLHPRLAKRGLNQDGTLSDDFPPKKLLDLMLSKPKYELSYQKNIVENITVFGNMASASLRTGYPRTRWIEYIHLFKEHGKWKIINVFWEFEK